MESLLGLLKEFLESIPQFLSDLAPDDEYLKAPGLPNGAWKTLVNYVIEDSDKGDGFIVSGKLAIPLVDLIMFSGWHVYKQANPGVNDDALYEMYIADNPNVASEFNLEDFCTRFNDFYLEFLNNAGIDEKDIELDGNSVRLVNIDLEPETELSEDITDDDEDDENNGDAEAVDVDDETDDED